MARGKSARRQQAGLALGTSASPLPPAFLRPLHLDAAKIKGRVIFHGACGTLLSAQRHPVCLWSCFSLRRPQMYEPKELLQARLDILKHLSRSDEAVRVYDAIHGEGSAPATLKNQDKHTAMIESRGKKAKAVVDVINAISQATDGEESTAAISKESDFTEEALAELGIRKPELDALYHFALSLYSVGETEELDDAAKFLFYYLKVCPGDSDKHMSARWGKLAAEILTGHYDEAETDCKAIQQVQEEHTAGSKAMQLQQRCWLAHWRLFPLLKKESGLDDIVNALLLDDTTLSAIVLCCPWLLRYVAAALILRREPPTSSPMRALLRALAYEDAAKDDPILDLLRALLVRFDFDDAEKQLAKCETVIRSDFFLGGLRDVDATVTSFLESSRQLVFETHCRLNSSVSIGSLAAQLGLEADNAEEWVVGMVRKAQLDARIDTERGLVVMRVKEGGESPGRLVLDRTADLVARTAALQRSIDSAMKDGGRGGDSGRGGDDRRGGGGRGSRREKRSGRAH